MESPLWTSARDNPDFSPYKYMIAIPILFGIIFASFFAIMREHSILSLLGLLGVYAALCIFVGVFLLHSHIFNPREFLIIWKDKVFIQIPEYNSGWRIIPRDKFKIDVFQYEAKSNPNALADAPELVLEKPYRGKVYFLFNKALVSPKIGGTIKPLLSERDMEELIDILKPRRVMKTVFAPIGGYAYAKVNLESKFKELIDKILDVDFMSIAQRIYEDIYKVARASVSVNDTLIALSLFKREREVALFMEYCITEQIEKYMMLPKILKIGNMWHPNTGKFKDYLSNVLWVLALPLFLIFLLSIPSGSSMIMASIMLIIAVGISTLRGAFISYNGIMGDTRLSYYLGMSLSLMTDLILGVIHFALPFVAVMLVGKAATLPTFILYAYLVYSIAFTVLNIFWSIFSTGYIEYRKLAREWCQFMKKEEKTAKSPYYLGNQRN